MDRLDELAVLVAVIDAGSLAGAARRLRRSPPAVTRTLLALEQRIGARLVERTTRRLAPTEDGLRLAARARALLGDYAAMTGDAPAAPPHGLLRITAPVQFGRRHVVPIVEAFLDAHPAVRVELTLHDRNLNLVEDGLDAAVRIGHLADSSLVTRHVGDVRRMLVASPGYLAAHGAPQRPADLAGHATIFGTSSSDLPEWRFGADGRGAVVRLAPRLLVNEVEAQVLAARAGRGIARLLSYQVIDDLRAGSLVRLLPEFEPTALPVQIVTHGGGLLAPRTRAFLDLAWDRLRALPAIHQP